MPSEPAVAADLALGLAEATERFGEMAEAGRVGLLKPFGELLPSGTMMVGGPAGGPRIEVKADDKLLSHPEDALGKILLPAESRREEPTLALLGREFSSGGCGLRCEAAFKACKALEL